MNLSVCKTRIFLLFVFLSINIFSIKAQISDSFFVDFKWNGIERFIFLDDTIYHTSFENAFFDNDIERKNPLYRQIIPVHSENVALDFEVDVLESEMVPDEELNLLKSDIGQTPYYKAAIMQSRDNCNINFELSPYFINDGKTMRVLSCKVSYFIKETKRESKRSYVENSVLSSGKWYKMSIPSTGMYKISYSDMSSMGIDVSSINPKNIKIFHNGGGTLPVLNKDERHQDLVEIPIYVAGENDDSFDSNDYIVFYARGPVTWNYVNGMYERNLNPYSDLSYVFLTTDLGEGRRIENAETIDEDADVDVTQFVDYKLIEEDTYNINNMGASWYGNKFDAVTTLSHTFSFPNIVKNRNCALKSEVASQNSAQASFIFKVNGSQLSVLNFEKIVSSSVYAKTKNTSNIYFKSTKDDVVVDMSYHKSATSSVAWLDYLIINAWRELKFTGNVMRIRNPECFNVDKIYRYEIRNASNSMQVWDVTDAVNPKKMQLQMNSNVAAFKVRGSQDNEFMAFDGGEFKSASFVATVQNQDLHSKYNFDYLIITHPDFYSQAQRLKEIHSRLDDLEIEIVTPQQIYNEFSCGALDITAIRDYIKMIYDKSDKRLRYVLLFGDASYDFRNKSGNVCFIPTYESVHSVSSSCIASDDFYVCLDTNEGNMVSGSNVVDVALGRLPVTTLEDAEAMIDKIESYVSNKEDTMGSWRKFITFSADDNDTYYMSHAEKLQEIVKSHAGEDFLFDKIYLDAYPQVATSSGKRSPECNAAITNRVELGTSILNYIGHAGEVGWADERILTNEDILSWRNSTKLHLMITASCEFTRLDDHTRVSAGEYVFLNPNGGAIAMISAARVTFGSNNQSMMINFYEHLMDIEGGNYIAMGDMYVYAKQVGDNNSKVYYFIGDPALRLNFPLNKVELTSINNHELYQTDTLRALQNVDVKGVIKDVNGDLMTDFNGTVQINVYDKENTHNTFGDESDVYEFKLRDNIIFTGKVPVVNGEFTANFTLPKDINYSYGTGLMSFYAYSDKTDAQGSYTNFIVGGLNQDAVADEVGPKIVLFIDDENFVDGSMTNENPSLLAYIKDENGINTSGAGIGHDITATLTGATNKTYSLNQFYDAPLSMYEFGIVSYKFYNLNEGEHLLTFRAWDIYNNSNTATIRFNVVKGKIVEIENLVNYPNPMSDNTNFTFEHNQKDNEIDIVIRIYNVMGQLVRTIEEQSFGATARISPIRWDGCSDDGDKLPSGVYIYNVTISNSQNEKSTEYSKLIIE
ncbi:MAG: type IX secretion system sortase PorU [Bacteroidales bacterium]|nr:type IX secretion system sortase PorU [Bacteroidales bacterium]